MSEKPGFLHITRTGGTAVKRFILENYKDYFSLDGLEDNRFLDSSFFDNPFLILRDPLDRFISLYYYWIYGSEINKSTTPRYSMSDFILFLNKRSCELITKHTNFETFREQADWIKPGDYKKTVVILYKENLSNSMIELLNYHNIPVGSSKLNLLNFALNRAKKLKIYYFAKSINLFLSKKYAADIELYYRVINHPGLFKKVIK